MSERETARVFLVEQHANVPHTIPSNHQSMGITPSMTQIPVMCASVDSPLTCILVPLFPACSYLSQFEFKAQ